MIKMIYTLPDKMRQKKIFVWGINRDSMVVFAFLAFRGFNIAGFLSRERKYVGEIFFNRPVFAEKDLANDDGAVIVAADICETGNLPDTFRVFHLKELLAVNPDLMGRKVIIYGAGKDAEYIYRSLRKEGVEVAAFCVTKKDKDNFCGLPMISIDEIQTDKYDACIISGKNERYRYEKQYNLEQRNISEIYLDEFIPELDLQMSTFVQALHNAVKEKRQIYIYTESVDENAKLIVNMLSLYQIKVNGYLYKEEHVSMGIKNVFEELYEYHSKVCIIVNEIDKIRLQDGCELLETLGYSLSTFDYIGLRIFSYEYKNAPRYIPDSLLGYSDLGQETGFHVYGNAGIEDIRVVILGGSTSNDGTLRGECWPKMLYKKFCQSGYKVSVYNGAHCGQNVVHEFLRLIRDGWNFKPDYVISMSGVNDTVNLYPEIENRFRLGHLIDRENELGLGSAYTHGIHIQEDNFDFWLRMEKNMKAVSEAWGAKFLCYLQPMKFGKANMSLLEASIHDDEKREARSFREKSTDTDFYMNLIDLFDENEGMYIDACHYAQKAKKVLANIVFQDIVQNF